MSLPLTPKESFGQTEMNKLMQASSPLKNKLYTDEKNNAAFCALYFS